ncbi:MAG: hypothetical protein ACE5HT_07155 [Gemmatimonadales bacterium]
MEVGIGRPVVHWEFWSQNPETAADDGAFSLFEDPDGRVLGLWRQDSAQ